MNNLSLDIGGTKARVVIYNSKYTSKKEITYKTSDFFNQNGTSDLISFLVKVQNDFGNKFQKIGVSINCPIKNDKIIYSSLLGGEIAINLKSFFKKYFSFKEFTSDNDVFCMTKAEMKFGPAKKFKNILYVNIGTGLRVVATENKNIVRGWNNLAGEISQDLNWVDEIGKHLTTDFLPSGQGFTALSQQLYGKQITAKDAFKNKDKKIITLFIKYLAKIISRSCYFYNPEAIFFAGSLVKSQTYWFNRFKTKYYKVCHPLFHTKNIFISKLHHPASLGALID